MAFPTPMADFMAAKARAADGTYLDWTDNGCSVPGGHGDRPGGFYFGYACVRHDFGYRNYKRQTRFSQENRLRIDGNFKNDMYAVCARHRLAIGSTCRKYAQAYYAAVRRWG
ncbi:phospholipase [Actinoplanes couchii]|uniref:phospholipase n=1 Tax=Actinoplanes couchii TaxID=403638 RepID=UPI0035A22AB2